MANSGALEDFSGDPMDPADTRGHRMLISAHDGLFKVPPKADWGGLGDTEHVTGMFSGATDGGYFNNHSTSTHYLAPYSPSPNLTTTNDATKKKCVSTV